MRFDKTKDAPALERVLLSARPHDALTLWHVLRRTKGEDRMRIFARYKQGAPLPKNVGGEAIERGDPKAFDATWNALELGNTSWWREWKHNW